MKLFTFRTGGQYFGLESKHVYRVLEEVSIAPVCRMPVHYLGLLYYRGELFDVIDIGLLIKNEVAASDESPRILIMRWAGKKLALAPGVIHGLVWIDQKTDGDTVITGSGRTIHIMTPEKIWDQLIDV